MLGSMRESVKLSNSDLELKESKIQSLNNLITDCSKTIDSKSQELGENQKLIDQQTNELGVLQNQRDTIKQFIQILSEELVAKEQTRKEILETICRSSSEMEERAKEIKAAETEASNLNARSERVRQEVEGKEKELALLKNQIESEINKVTQLEREMEEETDIKKRDLELVLSKIEESGKQLAIVNEQLASQQRLLEIQSLELVSKETELGCVRESIKLSSSDLKLKEKMVESLNHRVSVCGKTIDSKSKELGEIQKLIEQQTNELGVMHRKKRDLALILNRIEESGKQLATIDRQLESRRKLLKIRSFKLLSANKKLGYVRKSIKLSSSDLKQKERMIHSLNNRVTVCGNTVDSKSKELGEIQKLIDQHTNELVVLRTQRDSIWQLIQGLSEELVAKEMELECVLESSKDFKFDIDVKEKRVQALNNLITISGEQLDMKSKELGEIQRELDLKKKRLRHMSTVLVKQEKQPAAAETAPFSEDALTHHEFPPSLSRDEVADHLRALPNPAEFVLEDVQEHISGELGLQDDSFLDILVLCLEELIEIQRRDDPQLQDKATQVATIWKGKITIEAPKSSLEALAFLLFIVAYGLKNLINEEEAALLASSIAHYEQAPRLFKSLSLNCEIRKFVKELIKKEQYIPAVRLVCLFKLNEEFSPSYLLEKEIINLRWSVLGKRPTESSQAKGKDAGRLRAILELVGDYKLEINIPGYLIAKLMIQRENLPPLVRCSVKHGTSSSNPQANSPNPASAHRSPNPAYAHRSPNPASAQSSSVNPQVPKPDVKPCLN
ncbi:unnamed protein product [Arabidopsis arenosa]|nr:unnamed protein product [Arabidopsis arenosa]